MAVHIFKFAKCLDSFITNKTTSSEGKLSAKSKSYTDLWVGWKVLLWFCVSFSLWDIGGPNPQKCCGRVDQKRPTISSARALLFMNTWTNAVPWFPVSFSSETVTDGSNDSIYHMYVSITGAVTTLEPAPELLKAHFLGNLVLMSWWREVGFASWVVPNFVGTPT